MKNTYKAFLGIAALVFVIGACKKQDYSLGNLTAPTNLVITTTIVGQDATHPNGDGSGDVNITITADNAISYKVDYGSGSIVELKLLPTGSVTKKYTAVGTHPYRITAVAYGRGGNASTLTKDISVRSDYTPAPQIVTDLTNNTSKTWIVDKSIVGHMGVAPWEAATVNPKWWAAGPNEKVACCNCLYTTTFTFAKVVATNTYSLTVASPDGVFTKTGALTTLPGIPAGDEGCYPYSGGKSDFSWSPASSGVAATPSDPANSPSTQTSMILSGVNTYIAYGATQKEYEILTITPTTLYLRVRGTETGNAWYFKLKPAAK